MSVPRRVGIVGYGALGKYLVSHLPSKYVLVWVWNRTPPDPATLPPGTVILPSLSDAHLHHVDLIVEVCHPAVLSEHGARLAALADLFIGSPTSLSDEALAGRLLAAAAAAHHGVYVPVGALWGAGDLTRMDAAGTLSRLCVTMKKHPASLLLGGSLGDALAAFVARGDTGEVELYRGPVRALAALAPNNVNTMAAACLATPACGGWDRVVGVLVADSSLTTHVIVVEAEGLPSPITGERLVVRTERVNPAAPGAVTGAATFGSFVSSLSAAGGRGGGLHLV